MKLASVNLEDVCISNSGSQKLFEDPFGVFKGGLDSRFGPIVYER